MRSLIALGLTGLFIFGAATVPAAGALPSTGSSYSGIIAVAPISMRVSPTGQYTMRGKYLGYAFRHKGVTSETGTESDAFVITLYGGLVRVPVQLEFTISDDAEKIGGSATFTVNGQPTTVPITLYRSFPYTKDSPAPQTGRHVIMFEPGDGNPPVPGRGVATVKVSALGAVKVTGRLADGAKITSSGNLTKDGIFRIVSSPYGRFGFFYGFARFAGDNTENVINWAHFTSSGERIFEGTVFSLIHRYTPPIAGTPAVVFGNTDNSALLNLYGGGLATNITLTIRLDTANKLSVVGENALKLQLSLNPKTGLIRGTANLEVAGVMQSRLVKLAVIQENATAQGFFVSPEPSGNVDLNVQ
jgi:hypothetical protein